MYFLLGYKHCREHSLWPGTRMANFQIFVQHKNKPNYTVKVSENLIDDKTLILQPVAE